jgi:hypothetical protein
MSAAGRKAISEATKKRWAAFHAAQRTPEQPAPKKAARTSEEDGHCSYTAAAEANA